MRGWTRPLRQDYGDKHRLYAYKCNGIPTKGCSFVVPGGRAIDTQVRDAVSVLLEHVASHTRGGLEVAWSQLANPDTSADRAAQVAGLKRAADKARTRLTRAATLLVDGELDRASYDLLREAAQADLEAAETELSHLRRGTNAAPVLPSLDVVMQAVGSWSRALQDSDTTTQRDVFALLLERVQVARLGWGRYQAKVIWTPLGAALASLQATQIA